MPGQFIRILAGLGISTLTAVMLIQAFHPHNVWFLAFIAFLPMLIAQHRILPVKWSGLAPAVGIGGWLYIFLGDMFGNSKAGQVIKIVVLVIIIIQVFTVPAILRFHQQTRYRWFVLHGIADWIGFEMVRSFIPPINTHAFIAQTMYSQPLLLQPISIFSVYGLGIVLMLVNFSLARYIIGLIDKYRQNDQIPIPNQQLLIRWPAIAGLILVIWLGISFIILNNAPENSPTIRVAAVQHNFPRPGHQDTADSQIRRLQALAEQAISASRQGAQLIVMPELGLGFDPQVEYTDELKILAEKTKAYLLIGYGLNDPRGWRNETVMLTPEGKFLEVYGKNHPTSPGEPPIITSGVFPVYNTSIGQLATIICNDIHWTGTTRTLARKGARLIAVPTLEAPGIAIEQVAQSVLRAVENRVAIVKADVAFSSAIIDPYGNIIAQRNGSPKGEAFALVADIPLGNGGTFYSSSGDWPGWLCLAGLVIFIALQVKNRQQIKKGAIQQVEDK